MENSSYSKPRAEYSAYLTSEIGSLRQDRENFTIRASKSPCPLGPAHFRELAAFDEKIVLLVAALSKFYSLFPEANPQQREKEGQLAQKAQ